VHEPPQSSEHLRKSSTETRMGEEGGGLEVNECGCALNQKSAVAARAR
jgi:hypothetical protein